MKESFENNSKSSQETQISEWDNVAERSEQEKQNRFQRFGHKVMRIVTRTLERVFNNSVVEKIEEKYEENRRKRIDNIKDELINNVPLTDPEKYNLCISECGYAFSRRSDYLIDAFKPIGKK